MYNITNLLGFIGLTFTFISGIMGIKKCSIEIMEQLNNPLQTRIN